MSGVYAGMFPEVIVAAVAVGLLRGGRLDEDVPIKKAWLLAPAFLLQFATNFVPRLGPVLVVASFSFLLWLGAANWHSTAFRVLTIGTALNAAVFAANGGSMPVDPSLTSAPGIAPLAETSGWAAYRPATPGSPLAFLGDIIYVRYPFPRIISVGDLFAVAGLFLLVQEMLGKPLLQFGPTEPSAEGGD